MSTIHNRAKVGEIAEKILLPGDPLRAKYIAETYLEDPKLVNDVRNMLCYTGHYKDREISVMGTGMGMPSMGIYSYELMDHYGVKELIRVGSCGAYQENTKLYDLIFSQGASTDSAFINQFNLKGVYSSISDYDLLEKGVSLAKKKNLSYHVGNIISSDIFYNHSTDEWKKWADLNVLAVDMETYALYVNAAKFKRKALTILTVSDTFISGEKVSAEERERSFDEMMKIALEIFE